MQAQLTTVRTAANGLAPKAPAHPLPPTLASTDLRYLVGVVGLPVGASVGVVGLGGSVGGASVGRRWGVGGTHRLATAVFYAQLISYSCTPRRLGEHGPRSTRRAVFGVGLSVRSRAMGVDGPDLRRPE